MYLYKGICQKNKELKISAIVSPDLKGKKLCNVCGTYKSHSRLRCPCCKNKLRAMPRSGSTKEVVQNQKCVNE